MGVMGECLREAVTARYGKGKRVQNALCRTVGRMLWSVSATRRIGIGREMGEAE